MNRPAGFGGRVASRSILRAPLNALQSPRARWSIPATGAIVAAAVAFLWQTVWPPAYVATARILVDPSAADASGAVAEWIATQAQIISSDRVARRVAADLGMGTASEPFAWSQDPLVDRLRAHLTVEVSSGSGIIGVHYASADPDFAVQVADAFVTAYDRVSQEIQAAAMAAMKERAGARLSALREEVDRAQLRLVAADRTDPQAGASSMAQAVRLVRLATPADWAGLPGERNTEPRPRSLLADSDHAALNGATFDAPPSTGTLQDARSELEQTSQTLLAARARLAQFDGDRILARPLMSVLNRARESVDARAPGPQWVIAIAVLGGLIAGWLVRFLARRVDRRVVDAQDLARVGLEVFGVLRKAGDSSRSQHGLRVSARRSLVHSGDVAPALP